MTARFGRNKRRQARAEIDKWKAHAQMLEGTITGLQSDLSAEMTRALRLDHRLRESEQAIDDARRYLGHYHAALPPQTFDSALDRAHPYDPVSVAVQRSITRFSPISPTESMQHKIADLYRLVTTTEDRNTPYGLELHAMVRYRDGKVGYAITQEAIQSVPREYLVRQIAQDVAQHLADHLKGK